jgi:uncharacterized membrane protein YfcA
MTPITIALLAVTMVATATLSGVFGMAGGMVLIGVLLVLLPLPDAMALHAVTQMASNGWRALLWRHHVVWRPVVSYLAGCALALALWGLVLYVPSKGAALFCLGAIPLAMRAVPRSFTPNPTRPLHGLGWGCLCMTSMLLTGVTGPMLDSYFLGTDWDRRRIVATKAVCQVFGHLAKLAYFGVLILETADLDPFIATMAVGCSMIGTTLGRVVLERLTDAEFRRWTGVIITTIASGFLVYGGWLLIGEWSS